MKFFALVVGSDVVEALAPFYVWTEVTPYAKECYCTRRDDRGFRDFTKPPWPECRFCSGTGISNAELNPAGRWDWFLVTRAEFRWRAEPRPLRRRDEYVGLCSAKDYIGETELHFPRRLAAYAEGEEWDHGRKADIDVDATFGEPDAHPFALVVDGKWHQADDYGWFPSVHAATDRVVFASEDWRGHFMRLVRALPDDAVLSLVSCHG
jgi:hypothetical protein